MSQFHFILYQLSRPLSYLRIKHGDKWIYDWFVPSMLTLITAALCYFFTDHIKLVSPGGMIDRITDFIAGLPGFFIAALAAVATFNKNDIDDLMANPPKLEILYQGQPMMVDMTRRRFLCVLFSYLTASSIFLVLATRIGLSLSLSSEIVPYMIAFGVLLYFFTLWQMITATLVGLYYLGERLHTPQ